MKTEKKKPKKQRPKATPKFKREIVKVQISIAGSYEYAQILVYNKDRSATYQGDATRDWANVMDGCLKKYFLAKVPQGKPGIIEIIREVKAQDW